jgi:hypothetical protein
MVKLKRPLWLMPLFASCYSYTPIAPASAPGGAEVRARITGAASDRIAPMLGTFDTRVLVGSVVENNAGSILLQIPMGAMPNVSSTVVPLQTRIPIAAGDLVSLEQRRLDRKRTSLLAGLVVGGVALGVSAALNYGGGGEQGQQPPDPPPIQRIPLVRLRF